MSDQMKPHGIFTDFTGYTPFGKEFNAAQAQIACAAPADPADVTKLLAKSTDDEDGRSPFFWIQLHDGTLMLATSPRGDTYMQFADAEVCAWKDDVPPSSVGADDFESRSDIRVEGANFAVTLEYIGEGEDGDYDPTDPDDRPLYRFSTQQRVDGDWEDLTDGSYCTQVPANCSLEDAQKVADYLLNQLELNGNAGLKRFCERLSWTTLDTVLPLAA